MGAQKRLKGYAAIFKQDELNFFFCALGSNLQLKFERLRA